MAGYLLRRLGQAALVLLTVAILTFVLSRFVGDPVNQMVGVETSPQERAALRMTLGLDDPLPLQLGRWLLDVARLELGRSWQLNAPVADLIAERLPATVELALASAAIAVLLGVPLGVVTAVFRDRWAARVLLALSLIGVSAPTFLIGILLIWLFSVQLGWLPSFGRGETIAIGAWTTGLLTPSGRRALVLPALTLGLFQLTLIMRLVRGEMIEILRSEHIRFARARGLRPFRIHLVHALKGTAVPVVTIAGLQLGSIIAFAVVTETVFQWPGLGLLFIQAVQAADIPVMAAYLMLTACLFVAINLAVDLVYALLDPRIRLRPAAI